MTVLLVPRCWPNESLHLTTEQVMFDLEPGELAIRIVSALLPRGTSLARYSPCAALCGGVSQETSGSGVSQPKGQ
jgi:hypothetical protein